jgi:Ca2+-binding EF-hand superfamily protein
MGNQVTAISPSAVALIKEETGFSKGEILHLHARFQELDNDGSGIISRKEFLAIPELTLNPLSDRIIHAFYKGSENDLMDFRSFVKILARFRPIGKDDNDKHNKKMDKLRFAFSMYDLDNDGSLNQAVSLLLNTGTCVKSVSLRKW